MQGAERVAACKRIRAGFAREKPDMNAKIRIGALIVLVPLVAIASLQGCGTTTPRQDSDGRALPAVTGKALDGREWRLPDDLNGEPSVLLVGYEQNAQFDADRWLYGLLQAKTPARVLEVPAIPNRIATVFAGAIDEGMRSGIPSEDWGAVVTLYGADARAMREFTGDENGRNMRVLVLDADGVVRWHHDRGFSAGKLLELDTLVRSWKAGGS